MHPLLSLNHFYLHILGGRNCFMSVLLICTLQALPQGISLPSVLPGYHGPH